KILRRKRTTINSLSSRMKTPNPKLQTPEKFQITSSKTATSRAELGFAAWDFFCVWSLDFGVFINGSGHWADFRIATWPMTDRRAFYDRRAAFRPRESQRYYHELLRNHCAFVVPPGMRVLELGCGLGDLLAAVKPARGTGVDFSPAMIELARRRHPELQFQEAEAQQFSTGETFDYMLLSDLVND